MIVANADPWACGPPNPNVPACIAGPSTVEIIEPSDLLRPNRTREFVAHELWHLVLRAAGHDTTDPNPRMGIVGDPSWPEFWARQLAWATGCMAEDDLCGWWAP